MNNTEGLMELLRNILSKKSVTYYYKTLEIGCGNGKLLKSIAKEFPKNKFVGCDFHVPSPEVKVQYGIEYDLPNMDFWAGYALEYCKVYPYHDIKMVFANTTFLYFLPLELREYMKAFVNSEVEHIVIRDTFWGGYEQENNNKVISKHMEGSCWFHNYAGYFREYGYEVGTFTIEYISTTLRPDCYSILIEGVQKDD